MKQTQSNQWKLNLPFAILMLSIFVSGSVFSQSYFSDKVEKLWESDQAFRVPESVFYDSENDILYVANINGKPTEKDGNGFISRLHPNGKIGRLEWIMGLNAPKGMNMLDGKLYVADIDQVAEIDVKKGKILRFFEAGDAEFLNDITVDDDGKIYISDMRTGAVYKIEDNEITQWFPAGTFESPNGMNFMNGKIYLGTKGAIISIDPGTKKQEMVAGFEGSVDGLEIDRQGRFVFSNWSGLVRRIAPGGEPEILFNTTEEEIQAADIHLIVDQDILLVPTFFNNRITAYQIRD